MSDLMKIISWNVNGIKKNKEYVDELIEQQNPDILCIQEVKTSEIPEIENYTLYGYPSSKISNHYGTAIYSKVEPISIKKGFGDKEFDSEGRVIRLEFENFYRYENFFHAHCGNHCPRGGVLFLQPVSYNA